MKVILNIDLEKFRYSIIGDGYIEEEAIKMSKKDLINELEYRISRHIEKEYNEGKEFGWY